MAIDLSSLTLVELNALQHLVELAIPRRQAAERSKAVADLKQLAADRGFDLSELLGQAPKAKAARTPAPVKYRSQEGQEWSGRGRKPNWVVEHLGKGGKLEELAA